MSIRKESRDKPFTERKEGDQMPTMQIIPAKKSANSLDWMSDFLMKTKESSVIPVEPPHDSFTQFERDVIQECREMGMTDDEIQKWMKEI